MMVSSGKIKIEKFNGQSCELWKLNTTLSQVASPTRLGEGSLYKDLSQDN